MADGLERRLRAIGYNFTDETNAVAIAKSFRDKIMNLQVKWQQEGIHLGAFIDWVIVNKGIVDGDDDAFRRMLLMRSRAGEAIQLRNAVDGIYTVLTLKTNAVNGKQSHIDNLYPFMQARNVDHNNIKQWFLDSQNQIGTDGARQGKKTLTGTVKEDFGPIWNRKDYAGKKVGAQLFDLWLIARGAKSRNELVNQREIWEVKFVNKQGRSETKTFLDQRAAEGFAGVHSSEARTKNNSKKSSETAGSGMTDAEADVIIEYMQSLDIFPQIMEADQAARIVIRDTNRMRRAFGLAPLSFDDGMKSFYVPMLGKADPYFHEEGGEYDEELDEVIPLNQRERASQRNPEDYDVNTIARTGRGMSVRGNEDRRVIGRTSLPFNIVQNIQLQNTATIIRGNKARVGQGLAAMMRKNWRLFGELKTITDADGNESQIVVKSDKVPNSPAWEIDETSDQIYEDRLVKVQIDGKTVDKIKRMPKHNWKDMFEGKLYHFKENGSTRILYIEDPKLARALTRSNAPEISHNNIVKVLMGVNHWLSMASITYNPEFTIPNFSRDLIASVVNVNQYELDGISADLLKNVGKSVKGLYQFYIKGRDAVVDTEISDYIKEMHEAGGLTSFYGLQDLQKTMQSTFEHLALNVGAEGQGARTSLTRDGIQKLTHTMENVNRIAENATRLSLFMALRKRGFSPAQAASASKGLVVDFNAGGEYKVMANSLYLFYNASVQGSATILQAYGRSQKVRNIVHGIAVSGFASDFMNALISPEDESGRKIYDTIPDYVLEHNIIILDFFGITKRGYFAIPMPYGYNAISNTGRLGSRLVRGKDSAAETVFGTVGGLVDAFNPFGGSNSWMNFVSPTILDPFVDIAMNNDFANRPIHKEESPFGADVPDSAVYWNSTNPLFIEAAGFIADPLGTLGLKQKRGSELPGMIEIHPDTLEYSWGAITGGLGTTLRRMADIGYAAFLSPDGFGDFSSNNIPILRRFYGNITTRNDLTSYIEGRDWAETILKEESTAKDNGDYERLRQHRELYKKELPIARQVKALNSQRIKLAKQIRKIQDNGRIPQAERDKRVKQLRERQDEVVMKANLLMNQANFEPPGLMNIL